MGNQNAPQCRTSHKNTNQHAYLVIQVTVIGLKTEYQKQAHQHAEKSSCANAIGQAQLGKGWFSIRQ